MTVPTLSNFVGGSWVPSRGTTLLDVKNPEMERNESAATRRNGREVGHMARLRTRTITCSTGPRLGRPGARLGGRHRSPGDRRDDRPHALELRRRVVGPLAGDDPPRREEPRDWGDPRPGPPLDGRGRRRRGRRRGEGV